MKKFIATENHDLFWTPIKPLFKSAEEDDEEDS